MYQLPKLPYLYQDLEPFVDTHTMGLHYYKHEKNYLNQLNKLLIKNHYDYRYSLEELFYHVNEFPEVDRENILFSLGGVLNHNLYWKSMNPYKNKRPEGLLKSAIDKKYGNFELFWEALKASALELKGAGYTFFVMKKDGSVDIINLSNQEIPMAYGYFPLFNIDLWEHAYYLNYQNDKARYLDNFSEIADFTYANQIFNLGKS